MQAMFDASIVEDDGKLNAYVLSTEVVAALVYVTASCLEGAPGCEKLKGMRELSEGIRRKIRVQMREMRKIIDTTGIRPFQIVPEVHMTNRRVCNQGVGGALKKHAAFIYDIARSTSSTIACTLWVRR